ncbi:dickkopf-related protein 2-like [Dendronephthya gigantea]|uniref:dickkopf-related protein 2-like n=1 Tax=Dendronephthya gigantea TaxID=151771 RepID=UPI00106C33FA|nr:dickkopf-related protein 2-like [Dendronephthya gigantea]
MKHAIVNMTYGFQNYFQKILFKNYCLRDRQCGRSNYCHRHYGTCHKCKKSGAKCRRDHVCCKGFECAFGSCRRIVKRGNYLAKCKKDKHCKKGLCCAKSHGEFVCKPLLRENQICSVLEGGVAYAVNHGCPCDDGLACKRWKVRSNRGTEKKFKKKLRRCQKIN